MTLDRRRAAALATLGLAVVGAGCSSGPGEIMLAIQTDMALPKDIDTITVEVFNGAAQKFSKPYSRLGTAGAEVRLPATLGLVVSDDPSDVIRVKVSALVGGELGAPRVLREVVTTLPEDRVALLHVPLHFLCDGSARWNNGDVENAECGGGETCIAGACGSSTVSSAGLPDYAPEDVYGGGTSDGGGDCFDVAGCFADAAPATLDSSDGCSVEAAGDVNVALRTSGDGICGDAGCLVALDSGVEGGFSVEDGRARLPAAVCEQVASGKVIGVVTAPVAGNCRQKTVGLPTCGPWSASGS